VKSIVGGEGTEWIVISERRVIGFMASMRLWKVKIVESVIVIYSAFFALCCLSCVMNDG